MGDPEQEGRRRELGAFIRSHRERVRAIAAGARRRTPGLRREEVAELCQVSTTWITWLEQGRPVNASPAVLGRLAQSLQLTAAERAYMFNLAGRRDPEEGDRGEVADSVLRYVQVINCPAYLMDQTWDVVVANGLAADLFLNWGGLEDGDRPNLVRFMFLCPDARTLVDDWNVRSRRLVAEFRADSGRLPNRPRTADLIAALREASNEFAAAWSTHEVLGREGGMRRFNHPEQGQLVFEQATLHPASRPDLKLVLLLPAPLPDDQPVHKY